VLTKLNPEAAKDMLDRSEETCKSKFAHLEKLTSLTQS